LKFEVRRLFYFCFSRYSHTDFSSLDKESKRYIQASLDKLSKNRMIIIVAFGLSSIRSADEIMVSNNGIQEQGIDED
jgi:ATP-binding cassette subfamily B protein